MLLVASYIFYGSWNWKFLFLIFFSTIVDYFCGKKLSSEQGLWKRRGYLLISVVVNLGALAFFKYFNFFIGSFVSMLNALGLSFPHNVLNIVLPVGISFYTFQTMCYTIDIYHKKLEPEHDFINFALYVSFFPQLVAGPIERAGRLLPQITSPRKITQEYLSEGAWYILWGYFLKIFMADNLAKIADTVFSGNTASSGLDVLLGVYAFAFQIFGDFAGYSFIAIGVAKLMGFDLMTNFLYPYFVTNPSDFWKNWHISLSSWLKDYLYVPLGGNRRGKSRTYLNLMTTMLLGGLWHGAAWTFVLWGFYQGLILMIHRFVSGLRRSAQRAGRFWGSLSHFVKVIFMFQVTCVGWLIFRANSMEQLGHFGYSLFWNFPVVTAKSLYFMKCLVFYSFFPLALLIFQKTKNDLLAVRRLPWPGRWAVYGIIFYLMVFFGEYGGKQFIYFQF